MVLLSARIVVSPTPTEVLLWNPPYALADMPSSLNAGEGDPVGCTSPLAVPAVIVALFALMTAGAAEIGMVNFVQQSC
jgi:hypothetical protein